MAGKRVPSRRGAQARAGASGIRGFGRLLHESRAPVHQLASLGIGAVVFIGLGIDNAIRDQPIAAVVGLVCVGTLMACCAVYLKVKRFCFHEEGIREIRLMGEKRLRYVEAESVTWSAEAAVVMGVNAWTHFKLLLEPLPGSGGRTIRCTRASLGGQEPELEELRDHIARVIAGRMAEELRRDGHVQWTPSLRITQEGIEHTPSGLLGAKKEPVLYRFKRIADYDFEGDTFQLYVRGREKPVVRESLFQPNFFPGLALLTQTWSKDAAGDPEPAEDSPA